MIIDEDQANLDRSLMEPEISSIDSYILEFFEGLPREYRTKLKAEDDLADTCSKVIMIHKRLEMEENWYKNLGNTFRPCDGAQTRGIHILRADNGNVPIVELQSPSFRRPTTFMLDIVYTT